MKILKVTFSVLGIMMLTACTNTVQGVGKDVKDTRDWARGRPSTLERIIGSVPTGYHGPREPLVVVSETPARVMKPEDTVTWDTIDNYDAMNPELPAEGEETASSESVKYNDNVNVFPLEDGAEPAVPPDPVKLKSTGKVPGEMVEQVFFEYGSSRVSPMERKNLRELAESLAKATSKFKLSVVGHASLRVNNVTDPVERKMINFEMALKRANAVTQELRKAGVKPDWVLMTSRGDTEPNQSPGDKSQEAADQRVEVFMGDK